MLIENPAFIDHYTAAQNLKLIANIHRKVGEERIREVLEQVGLGADDPRKYKQFSLGMKQRLGIAGAILEYPALLLIDEPTNALDTDGIEMVRDLLLEQKQRRRTDYSGMPMIFLFCASCPMKSTLYGKDV